MLNSFFRDYGDILLLVFIGAVIVFVISFALIKIDSWMPSSAASDVPDYFEVVYQEKGFNPSATDDRILYFRDVSSDVMYVYISGYRKAGLSVMFSPDGTPLLYSEWMD